MKRKDVESSMISSIGYDGETQILEVEFKNGATYQYYKVPKKIHKELMDADSHGTYFHKNIKEVYDYKKIFQ